MTSGQFAARKLQLPSPLMSKNKGVGRSNERSMRLQIAARGTLSRSLIIQNSSSSCEMSTAKRQNRLLQSVPHSPTATHSSWIISYLSWRRSEEDLERNPKTRKKREEETLDKDKREKPNTPSHHQPPLPADDFTGQSGGSGSSKNTYCILLAMFLQAYMTCNTAWASRKNKNTHHHVLNGRAKDQQRTV